MQKTREDQWDGNPPQVTSFLELGIPDSSADSPVCGFGWRFRYEATWTQLRGFSLSLWFDPHLCCGMRLQEFSIELTIVTSRQVIPLIPGVAMRKKRILIHNHPLQPVEGSLVQLKIKVTFNANDGLCFPTFDPPPVQLQSVFGGGMETAVRALRTSLVQPSFADTKIYLYSAKSGGRARRPRPLFGNSDLLASSCSYFKDFPVLLENDFKGGVPCDLYSEDVEVIQTLSSSGYGYDSDSDLESVSDGEENEDGKAATRPKRPSPSSDDNTEGDNALASLTQSSTTPHAARINGRAFAINGTAYKTLQAYIMYTYTNDIEFSPLKSARDAKEPNSSQEDLGPIRCSPKSMYRFADFANIPVLRGRAKEGIKQSLTKENIVTELFCPFTSKYPELIKMETEFLVRNFTAEVEHAFDEVLQTVVVGVKPYCYQVLGFAMKRLRGTDAETAWAMVNTSAA